MIILIALLAFLLADCGNGVFHAAAGGDVEAVREQLERDPGLIHSRDKHGYTLLHLAARQGHAQLVEFLIARGAVIDERSLDGDSLTPLHLAASEGRLETAALLIDKGADIEARSKGARYNGWNALVFAGWNDHKDMVALLIEKGAAVKPVTDKKINPLWFPVYKGYKDIVELLLAKGAQVDIPEIKSWGPLHSAVARGNREMVQLLLEHGADVNRRCYGRPPLHSITYWRSDHPGITRLLLSYGAEVNAGGSNRETALHLAARGGFTGTAALLLEKGAAVDINNDMEQTPLDLAYHEGRKAIVRLLLSLHTAVKSGDLNRVTKLIKTRPQLIHARDIDYKTPLHYAAENNHLQIASLLIANGAAVNVRCKYKHIQLLYGVVAKLLIPRVGRVKRIKDQKTPLDFARQKGYSQMVHLLKAHMVEGTGTHYSLEPVFNHGAHEDGKKNNENK